MKADRYHPLKLLSPFRPLVRRVSTHSTQTLDYPLTPNWLYKWQNHSRIPVLKSSQTDESLILRAAASGQKVTLLYYGGQSPGLIRTFIPEHLFKHTQTGPTYLSGFCHLRQSRRILRTDRLSVVS